MRKLLVTLVSVGVLVAWLVPAGVAGAAGALPTAPGSATAVAGNGVATVSWTAPSNTGGKAITGYLVTPVLGTVAQAVRTFNSSATKQVVTGLANGRSYRFRVAAKTTNGTGPQSALPSASLAIVVGAPSQVGLVVASPRSGSAVVSWSAPTTTNGAAVTGYLVTPLRSGVLADTPLSPVLFTSTARVQTVPGLANGTPYKFRVAAINARGTGASSPSSSPAIIAGSPLAPTGLVVTVGARSVSASWAVPPNNGSPVDRFNVWQLTGDQTVSNTAPVSGSMTSLDLWDLVGGATYRVVVQAANARGGGLYATSAPFVAPAPLPLKPTAPTATAGNGQAVVRGASSGNDNITITGFKVTPIQNGVRLASRTVAPWVEGPYAFNQAITGLTNGATYRFVFAVVTRNGTGPESPPSASIIVGAPGPISVDSKVVSGGSATITWPPAPANGSPITSYVITPLGLDGPKPAITVPASHLSATIDGLGNPFGYLFSVAGINAYATGYQGSFGPGVGGAVGAPSPPTVSTFEVSTRTGSYWVVAWTPPSNDYGSPVTGYTVFEYRTDAAGSITSVERSYSASDATSYVPTPPPGGSSYVYVVAINGRGQGAPDGYGPFPYVAPTA